MILDIVPKKNIRLGIWNITESVEILNSLIHLTPSDEIIYNRMKNENRKKQWLSYRILLQHFSGKQPLEIQYNEFGKPFIKNRVHQNFSASHSRSYAAVISGTSPWVGIDIEKISPRLLRVRERFLSKKELDEFGTPVNLEKLCIFWCAKEALYKVYGIPEVDLKNDIFIHSFDYICTTSGHFTATITKPEKNKEFTLWYIKLEDHILVYTYE
jgi:4'-phosphopantetheinyl transferase